MENINKYQIKYGDIIQYKVLIPHSEYLHSKKLFMIEMNRIDIPKKQRNEKIGKQYLENKYGENWFTDESPLYNAIETNVLNCNGIYNVEINEI